MQTTGPYLDKAGLTGEQSRELSDYGMVDITVDSAGRLEQRKISIIGHGDQRISESLRHFDIVVEQHNPVICLEILKQPVDQDAFGRAFPDHGDCAGTSVFSILVVSAIQTQFDIDVLAARQDIRDIPARYFQHQRDKTPTQRTRGPDATHE